MDETNRITCKLESNPAIFFSFLNLGEKSRGGGNMKERNEKLKLMINVLPQKNAVKYLKKRATSTAFVTVLLIILFAIVIVSALSFSGWIDLAKYSGETNIRPWRSMMKKIQQGNKKSSWKERIPFAYWRGNPNVSPVRKDLMKCNVTHNQNWDTLLYIQDWSDQSKKGYKESNIEDQCTHRFKIYVEGWAWSVSEKYIFACDSPTLYITPRYYDFFMRGMIPQQHYWPIRDTDKCRSLKFAVQWGNNHTDKAQAIGNAGSHFIHEDMKMEYVFDYIYHLLNEYVKLQKFDPIVPPNAIEICSESLACSSYGIWRKFMEEALEKSPSYTEPCTLPPPYNFQQLKAFVEQKVNATKQVEEMEDEYWSSLNKSTSLAFS
ncbi:uncharacterized protein LOC107787453 [Nicotiana tabacum]|uniref:Uncharacterized protein LOC107787453 n=1 Tax=Nicotiana tabacum TaxID=4097 RepID=A0AC58SJQ3_TOBAC